ncbi:MAG: hypothetical protein FWD18_02680 [Micrococcales bacterium]|nr:hypothetical protein [Micrococcales bacterium]
MRRLFWVGVGVGAGVGLTVLVIRKGRSWYATMVPEPASGAVDTAIAVSRGLRHALEEFRAGRDEKEAELMAALIGDRDVDQLRATAPERRERLAKNLRDRDRHRTEARIAQDWADAPTEDPDDATYSF